MKAYVIDWLDHGEIPSASAWNEIGDISTKPFLLRSVCFVVSETPEAVFVAHTARDTQCSTPFMILRSCIVRMDPIKLPPLRRSPKKAEADHA